MLVAAAAPARALDPGRLPSQFVHQSWDRSEGLPGNVVWALHESADGYLWAGTDNGLVRFDGHRFTVFNGESDAAFLSNDVRGIAESPQGTLWLATYGGGLLRLRDGALTRFDRTHGLVDEVLYDVHAARDGTVWVGTAGGACRWTASAFECWKTGDGLAGDRISRIDEGPDGSIWLATLSGGVSRFDGRGGFDNITPADGLDAPQVFMLYGDPRHGMVFGTYGGSLYHVAEGGGAALLEPGPPGKPAALSALRDGAGSLWVGTNGKGLYRLGAGAPFATPAFSQAHVWSLLEDRHGGLWVGTSDGLHRFGSGPFVTWGADEGLANGSFVVSETTDGSERWIGTEGNGVLRLAADGQVRAVTSADGLPSNAVSALLPRPSGGFWVGTFGGGLAVLDPDGGIVDVLTVEDGLASNQVMSLWQGRDGSVWVGAAGGISRLEDGVVTRTLTERDGLPTNLVRHISEDTGGDLWLSTDSGLARLSPAAGTVTAVLDRSVGLASSVVSTTFVDERGVVWIGSRNGGLARLEDGRLHQFTPAEGVKPPSIMAILQDASENLWLAGRSGLAMIPRQELDALAAGTADRVWAREFTEHDGLRSVRVPGGYQPAAVRAGDGRLWFATDRGVATVDPSRLEAPALTRAVFIEALRADGETLRADASGNVRLPAGTRTLEIDYALPLLRGSERLVFRYRLTGAGNAWHRADSRRTAFFTSPPPGSLRFEVAATLDGLPFEEAPPPAALTLDVAPLWHQTPWFRTLIAALVLLLIWAGYRIALSQQRRRERALERTVAERTAALREALEAVERISRTDGLTGIANRRYFEEQVGREWSRSVRHGLPITVLMIDIDHFKQYNDFAGHQAGDQCLREVAGALARTIREGDFVARYGGEEFVVLLPETDSDTARLVAERIQAAVRGLGISHPAPDAGGMLTVSGGYATAWPGVIDTPDELVSRADRALYRAKRTGRDTVVYDLRDGGAGARSAKLVNEVSRGGRA